MRIFPNVKFQASNEIEPGHLFFIVDYVDESCFAIKTSEGSALILGPNFGRLTPEPMTVNIDSATCLSYGNDFIISICAIMAMQVEEDI